MYVILLILSNEEKLPCKFHDIIHVRADVIYSLTLKIAVIQTFAALGLIFHISNIPYNIPNSTQTTI